MNMEEPTFDHLSDREILILTCRETFNHSKRLDSHAVKIRDLELWRAWILGGLGVIGALCAVIVGLERLR